MSLWCFGLAVGLEGTADGVGNDMSEVSGKTHLHICESCLAAKTGQTFPRKKIHIGMGMLVPIAVTELQN